MAYHLLIFKQSTGLPPTIDLYFGSAQTVHLYWESAGEELGLPTISTITDRAESEAGFCLSGAALTAFKEELKQLYEHWNQSHGGYALSPHHSEVMRTVLAALDDESFEHATLIIG